MLNIFKYIRTNKKKRRFFNWKQILIVLWKRFMTMPKERKWFPDAQKSTIIRFIQRFILFQFIWAHDYINCLQQIQLKNDWFFLKIFVKLNKILYNLYILTTDQPHRKKVSGNVPQLVPKVSTTVYHLQINQL